MMLVLLNRGERLENPGGLRTPLAVLLELLAVEEEVERVPALGGGSWPRSCSPWNPAPRSEQHLVELLTY